MARSNEAKALGIAMGEPAFKIRHLVEEAGLVMLSSNYALYGDMSARVMSVLATFAPAVEVYSIDECFLYLEGMPQPDLTDWARQLRATVRQWTGIPVSVGVAQTKTLAKLANRLAKKSAKADGALDLTANPAWVETALKRTDVADVWGIGRQFAGHCYTAGIRTAWDLSRAEDGWIRKVMGAVGLRTVMELRGIAVHQLDDEPADKQTTCCSRSFGNTVTGLDDLHDAVVTFAARAAEKIRKHGLVAGALQVFAYTDRFRPDQPQHTLSSMARFQHPTSDAREIIGAAVSGLRRAWKDGYAWKKAGVLLVDLVRPEDIPRDLFAPAQQESAKPKALMAAMNDINGKFGRGAAGFGLVKPDAAWRMHQGNKSPSYTTAWDQIPAVRA